MQNKPSNIQITSSKIQFTPPQTFKYHNELQKQSYIMKNNKNITGPDCPGPNCPPPKSGKLGPGQLGPGAQLSGTLLSTSKKWQIGPRTVRPRKYTIPKTKKPIKNKTLNQKYKHRCYQISFMFPKIPNKQWKTKDFPLQIENSYPKSHNHNPKYQLHQPNH